MSEVPCSKDPELWFADAEYLKSEAKRQCMGCPGRLQCLEIGMTQDFGIWGGLDAKERSRIYKRQTVMS